MFILLIWYGRCRHSARTYDGRSFIEMGNHSSQLHNLLYTSTMPHHHRYYADNRALWYVTIHWKVLIFHSNAAFLTRRWICDSFFCYCSSFYCGWIFFFAWINLNVMFQFGMGHKWDYYFKSCLTYEEFYLFSYFECWSFISIIVIY